MIKVLCLDIEGGHGGSSRSLFQSISHLSSDPSIEIEVWCRREGSIQNIYKSLGISVSVFPSMPKMHSVPRISRNIFLTMIFFIYDWPKSYIFRRKVLEKSRNIDLIHLNIDGLYWLSRWLNKRTSVPITMHKRTNPWPSFFSRIQMGVISRHVTRLIFITENEERNYIDLGGRPDHGQVIYNIVPQVEKGVLPLELISNSNRFKICCLANYSYYRGIDRLIDIAIVLQKSHGGKFIFIVAGDISLTKSLPGKLGEVARSGGNLSDYARIMGVEEMFLFLGHVSNPEKVLAGCNALIRPSRENNPWGRDVLEAMSSSLPVIATGSYNRFVEDGVTGFLLKEFNSNKISEYIVELSLDRKKAENMGSQGCKRVQNLCGGVNRSKDLLKFWKDVCKV